MELTDLRSITDLKGKRVLLRAPLNVPIKEGRVISDFRIVQVLPTIQFLKEKGAKVIIVGHVGRESTDTLEPIYSHLKKSIDLTFVKDIIGSTATDAISVMQDGDVVLLENLRQKDGEYMNDESFSKHLASFADIYVNDAFAASHRSHASIVGIPSFIPGYAGFEFKNEIEHLGKALNPQHPSLFILGGAKFDTKRPLIHKFLDIYDTVFVGGALANDFFKAKGFHVGNSLVSSTPPDLADIIDHPNLVLPSDVIVENKQGRGAKKLSDLTDDDCIFDAGPETTSMLIEQAKASAFVLWNGPLGNYEKGFNEQTEKLARAMAECSVECIVGGGDTVASIAELKLLDKFSFVSTAGGAMLQFLLEGTLPGIEALNEGSEKK